VKVNRPATAASAKELGSGMPVTDTSPTSSARNNGAPKNETEARLNEDVVSMIPRKYPFVPPEIGVLLASRVLIEVPPTVSVAKFTESMRLGVEMFNRTARDAPCRAIVNESPPKKSVPFVKSAPRKFSPEFVAPLSVEVENGANGSEFCPTNAMPAVSKFVPEPIPRANGTNESKFVKLVSAIPLAIN